MSGETNQKILNVLRDMPGTAAEIAQDIGAHHNTVGMALSRMLRRGIVYVIGEQQPDRGRPARIYGAVE